MLARCLIAIGARYAEGADIQVAVEQGALLGKIICEFNFYDVGGLAKVQGQCEGLCAGGTHAERLQLFAIQPNSHLGIACTGFLLPSAQG